MNVDGLTPTEMVDIMVRFNITAKQFLLLFILETDKLENKGHISGHKGGAIANIYRLAEREKWSFDEIDDLIAKDLLIDHTPVVAGTERSAYPDFYQVSDLFIGSVITQMTDFEEFWSLYPGFCDNFQDFRGPKVPLKAVDYEEVEKLYMKYIHTKAKHAVVIKVLKWAIDTNQVNMSIQKYVSSRMWDQHAQLRRQTVGDSMSKSIHRRKV